LHKDPVDADGRRSIVVFFLFVVVEQKMTDIIFVVAVAFTTQIKCVIAVLLIPTNYCITKLNLNLLTGLLIILTGNALRIA
jgi:hypothetical protein